MGSCKKEVTPLLMHWSYIFLALTPGYVTQLWDIMELVPLHWRHNGYDCVSNHQPHNCLLNRLFRHRSKKTSKLCFTGLCVGNSPGPVNSPHKWPVTGKYWAILQRDPTLHNINDKEYLHRMLSFRFALPSFTPIRALPWHFMVTFLELIQFPPRPEAH